MSKFCSNCGNALPDDAMFCGNCGSAVSNAQPAEPAAPPVQPETPVYTAPVQPGPAPYDGEVPHTPYTYADPAPQPPAKQTLMQKVKSFSLKIWLIIAAAVVVLGVGIWLIAGQNSSGKNSEKYGNTYETPIKIFVAQLNAGEFSWDNTNPALNGLGEHEYNTIMGIMKDCRRAEDIVEGLTIKPYMYEHYRGRYGDNYKFSYTIEDKIEWDKDTLERLEKVYRQTGEVDIGTAEYIADNDLYDRYAEVMHLSAVQMKQLVTAMKAFGEKWEDVEVTEGYEVSVTFTVTGDNLDEPWKFEETFCVYKVNGRWISDKTINDMVAYSRGFPILPIQP